MSRYSDREIVFPVNQQVIAHTEVTRWRVFDEIAAQAMAIHALQMFRIGCPNYRCDEGLINRETMEHGLTDILLRVFCFFLSVFYLTDPPSHSHVEKV